GALRQVIDTENIRFTFYQPVFHLFLRIICKCLLAGKVHPAAFIDNTMESNIPLFSFHPINFLQAISNADSQWCGQVTSRFQAPVIVTRAHAEPVAKPVVTHQWHKEHIDAGNRNAFGVLWFQYTIPVFTQTGVCAP
ncbi:MAG TPA: hypothetical protein VIS57_03490, partial [Xanthomonadales bacterium]